MSDASRTSISFRELLTKLEDRQIVFQFNGHLLESDSLEVYTFNYSMKFIRLIQHSVKFQQHNLNTQKAHMKKYPDEYSILYQKEIEQEQRRINTWLDNCYVRTGDLVSSYLSWDKKDYSCQFHCQKCNEIMDWVLVDENTLGLDIPVSQQRLGITDPTCKFKMPIPVDINRPRCPIAVINSNIADMIRDEYTLNGLKPDPELIQFLDQHPPKRGYEWQERVYNELQDKPIELIEEWIDNGLPFGLWKGKTRMLLKHLQKCPRPLVENNISTINIDVQDRINIFNTEVKDEIVDQLVNNQVTNILFKVSRKIWDPVHDIVNKRVEHELKKQLPSLLNGNNNDKYTK